jgi:hypothetical protein
MSHSDIYKQLVVNKLFSSNDLQNIVNSFIFYDAEFVKIKNLKRKIVGEITYHTFGLGEWVIQCGQRSIRGDNCLCCGNYYIDDFVNDIFPEYMLCSCDGEYWEEMIILYGLKRK